MDPLSLLREHNVNKQLDRVETKQDRVYFGDRYSFPLTSFTAFKKTGGDYYTLDVLLFLLTNRSLPHSDYLKATQNAKIAPVSLADRKVGAAGGTGMTAAVAPSPGEVDASRVAKRGAGMRGGAGAPRVEDVGGPQAS